MNMNIKSVCMYTAQIEQAGGIESVIRCLQSILVKHGLDCWVACETGSPIGIHDKDYKLFPNDTEARRKLWDCLIEAKRVDVVVFHHVPTHYVDNEIPYLKSRGVRCLNMIHAPFPSAFLLGGAERDLEALMARAKLCDMVVAVSRMDTLFWNALGVKAVHVQNPFVRMLTNPEATKRTYEDGKANLLWVGRFCDQKQPMQALLAFARVQKACPNATLTMVGGGEKGIKYFARSAKKLGITGGVTFVPSTHSIAEYWGNADIHLLTSVCESFCLVWAEAKSVGLPTVMFDMPYLELASDKRAYISVPQDDVTALADAAIMLVNDGTKRREMGRYAKESLSQFNHDSVWNTWENAFAALYGDVPVATISPEVQYVVTQCFWGWSRYCARNLWAIRMVEQWKRLTGVSMRWFAKTIDAVIRMARKVFG